MSSERVNAVIRQYILFRMPAIMAAGGKLDIEGISSLAEKYPDSPELRELAILANQQ